MSCGFSSETTSRNGRSCGWSRNFKVALVVVGSLPMPGPVFGILRCGGPIKCQYFETRDLCSRSGHETGIRRRHMPLSRPRRAITSLRNKSPILGMSSGIPGQTWFDRMPIS